MKSKHAKNPNFIVFYEMITRAGFTFYAIMVLRKLVNNGYCLKGYTMDNVVVLGKPCLINVGGLPCKGLEEISVDWRGEYTTEVIEHVKQPGGRLH